MKSNDETKSEIIDEWVKHHHRCKIVKTTYPSGYAHYCGYVQTPLRFHCDVAQFIDVHGGLTYGVDEDGWVGFDCAHYDDVCVDEDGNVISDTTGDKEWTIEKVRKEVDSLSWQLKQLEEFVECVS